MSKVYVGNLPYSYTDTTLEELFAQSGEVTSSRVIVDRDSGRSKGFGFVEMSSDDEADSAIEKFNGHEIEGRPLRVDKAKPKPARGPRY